MRQTLTAALLTAAFLCPTAPAVAAQQLSIHRARRAVIAEERRYWHDYSVKVHVGKCERLSPVRVSCNVSVTGVFTEVHVASPDGRVVTTPGPMQTVTFSEIARLNAGHTSVAVPS